MIRLRIYDILEEQCKTKYRLYKRMELSYQNFNKMTNNETASIRFENLEKLSNLLNCQKMICLKEQRNRDPLQKQLVVHYKASGGCARIL